jgi:hypothetical protein
MGWDGLMPDTVYDVQVAATDGKAMSPWCLREFAFRTLPTSPGAPGMPGPIRVTNVTDRSALIMWGPAPSPAGVGLAYDVELRERASTGLADWHSAGETSNTVLTVTGLKPLTVYDVRVRAWAGGVPGPYRVLECAFKTHPSGDNFPPSPPSHLTFSEITSNSVRIAWAPSKDPDGDPLVYIVRVRPRIGSVPQEWSAGRHTGETVLLWTGLTPNTVYDVQVAASDGKVLSPWCTFESAFRTLPIGPQGPGMPGPIAVTNVTPTNAVVMWGPAVAPPDAVVGYELQLRTRINGIPGEWWPAGETHETRKLVVGLRPCTVYDVRVRARANGVSSAWRMLENAFKTRPPENQPPSPPEKVEATDVTAGSVRIWWSASRDPNGDRLLYFVALRLSDGTSPWYPAASTACLNMQWVGLQAGTAYDVRVQAFDGQLYSGWTVVEHAFQTLPEGDQTPSAPGEIIVSNVTHTSACLAWRPATGPDGVALVYEVQIRARTNCTSRLWKTVGKTADTGLKVEGLLPGVIYDVQVRAWAGDVPGPWRIRELAFRTLPLLAGTDPRSQMDATISFSEIIWAIPDDYQRDVVVEEADRIGDWTTSDQPVEDAGGMKRLTCPLSSDTHFFRIAPQTTSP